MHYYEVRVASQRYHKPDALTYASETELKVGQVVIVPLQQERAVGVIVAKAGQPRFQTKQIYRALKGILLPAVLLQLADWLADYYPAPSGAILQLLLPSFLAQSSRSADSSLDEPIAMVAQPPLTNEQVAVVTRVQGMKGTSALLHGDTGSGKTRVYIELARQTMHSGSSAIILTPEIGLTPQLASDLRAAFGNDVVVLHSTLTPAERRNAWLRVAAHQSPLVVVGPRSALFVPLHNVGLIVIDEAHDQAYKQEQAPYYQTSRVAASLAALHGAKLLLGSATPSISDYFMFEHKGLPILRMEQPAIRDTHERTITVIPMREKQHFARSQWLSDALLKAIEQALLHGRQSLVFLNRRGTARLVLCQECGWQALCPHCDLPLTYHGDSHSMRCHTCGFRDIPPANCPSCQSTNITFRSIGTKTLLAEVTRLFPKARVQRFDSDNSKAERLEQHYDAIKRGDVDILVGTQLLSKGLDLPLLSVVGVALADTGLYFPDFTAEERTYQMLSQVVGRVGRGHGMSTIIVQTYSPDSVALQAAVQKNYQLLYDAQIAERKLYSFPPFCFVLKLSCSYASSAAAEKAAYKLAKELSALKLPINIVGPAPAFTEKVNNTYRWQIIVKSAHRNTLTSIVQTLPSKWQYDLDPAHLL